jgi:hypothetical protein
VIEGLLDLNHVSKNCGKHLRKDKIMSEAVAGLIQSAFDTTIRWAREHTKEMEKEEAVEVIHARLNSIGGHIFGDHEMCSSFCKAKTDPTYTPARWPGKKYLVDKAVAGGSTLRAEISKILGQYSSKMMCEKLRSPWSSNICEARHSKHWTQNASKNVLAPRAMPVGWKITQLQADLGRGGAVDAVLEPLGIARPESKATVERLRRDVATAKRSLDQKTPEAKIARALQKRARKSRAAATDPGHNPAFHLQDDEPVVTRVRAPNKSCALCSDALLPKHKRSACPAKAWDTPATPKMTMLVEPGDVICVLDVETIIPHNVVELGYCAASFSKEGGWKELAGEFNSIIRTNANPKQWGWTGVNCLGLKEACTGESAVMYGVAWAALLARLRAWRGDAPRIWIKAHNGVSVDMRALVATARRAGLADPLRDLADAGVAGVIDPKSIIIEHNVTSMRHGDGGKFTGFLKNDALFLLASKGKSMQDMKLSAHRATDDAKAERFWMMELPEMSDVMFSVEPRKACGISLASYREYHEQYDRNEELGVELARLKRAADEAAEWALAEPMDME